MYRKICKIRKRIPILLLTAILVPVLTGCGLDLGQSVLAEFKDNKDGILDEARELWDSFLDEANDWADSMATQSITRDSKLAGKRQTGIDNYVGSYEADYDTFTGEEFIFGGTSLKRKAGRDLEVTYTLTVLSGRAILYWLDGDEEEVIASTTDQGMYEISLHAGKNFITLEGEEFTGSLRLTVD